MTRLGYINIPCAGKSLAFSMDSPILPIPSLAMWSLDSVAVASGMSMHELVEWGPLIGDRMHRFG